MFDWLLCWKWSVSTFHMGFDVFYKRLWQIGGNHSVVKDVYTALQKQSHLSNHSMFCLITASNLNLFVADFMRRRWGCSQLKGKYLMVFTSFLSQINIGKKQCPFVSRCNSVARVYFVNFPTYSPSNMTKPELFIHIQYMETWLRHSGNRAIL